MMVLVGWVIDLPHRVFALAAPLGRAWRQRRRRAVSYILLAVLLRLSCLQCL